jgi:hypothetical protein
MIWVGFVAAFGKFSYHPPYLVRLLPRISMDILGMSLWFHFRRFCSVCLQLPASNKIFAWADQDDSSSSSSSSSETESVFRVSVFLAGFVFRVVAF